MSTALNLASLDNFPTPPIRIPSRASSTRPKSISSILSSPTAPPITPPRASSRKRVQAPVLSPPIAGMEVTRRPSMTRGTITLDSPVSEKSFPMPPQKKPEWAGYVKYSASSLDVSKMNEAESRRLSGSFEPEQIPNMRLFGQSLQRKRRVESRPLPSPTPSASSTDSSFPTTPVQPDTFNASWSTAPGVIGLGLQDSSLLRRKVGGAMSMVDLSHSYGGYPLTLGTPLSPTTPTFEAPSTLAELQSLKQFASTLGTEAKSTGPKKIRRKAVPKSPVKEETDSDDSGKPSKADLQAQRAEEVRAALERSGIMVRQQKRVYTLQVDPIPELPPSLSIARTNSTGSSSSGPRTGGSGSNAESESASLHQQPAELPKKKGFYGNKFASMSMMEFAPKLPMKLKNLSKIDLSTPPQTPTLARKNDGYSTGDDSDVPVTPNSVSTRNSMTVPSGFDWTALQSTPSSSTPAYTPVETPKKSIYGNKSAFMSSVDLTFKKFAPHSRNRSEPTPSNRPITVASVAPVPVIEQQRTRAPPVIGKRTSSANLGSVYGNKNAFLSKLDLGLKKVSKEREEVKVEKKQGRFAKFFHFGRAKA